RGQSWFLLIHEAFRCSAPVHDDKPIRDNTSARPGSVSRAKQNTSLTRLRLKNDCPVRECGMSSRQAGKPAALGGSMSICGNERGVLGRSTSTGAQCQ